MAHFTVPTQLQAHLGGSLRAVYESVVNESVPDRLRKLLDELERREMKSRSPPERSRPPDG
jgi:HEPN domain-containing protein